jgi:glucose-1-phosphate adenylyltransferase
MEKSVRVLAFVLAGGEGKRLAPLTRHVAKPAIPFHTSHRLIDFALSNLRNSGIRNTHVLMQYQPQSVLQHLMSAWRDGRPDPDGFVNPITGGANGIGRFAGTADAVYRNIVEIIDFAPEVVAIFSADHIYRMDVRQMIDFHLQSGADATVSAVPVPLAEAHAFGVIEAGRDGRIKGFAEKPQQPLAMPNKPGYALASMGNYLFSPAVLLQALDATHSTGGTDFGSDLLPSLVDSHRLMAYDFTTNHIDGLGSICDPHYWRDVGTIDAYFAAHMDTMKQPGSTASRFDVAARCWPIRGAISAFDPALREWALGSYQCMAGIARSAEVERSILRQGASIGERAEISGCILNDGVAVGADCRLRNVIVDVDNTIPDGFVAGYDSARDRERFPVSANGVVVIPRGFFSKTRVAPRARLVTRLSASNEAVLKSASEAVSQLMPSLNSGGAMPQAPLRREVAPVESLHAARPARAARA